MSNSTDVFLYFFRESVKSMQEALVNVTHVAKNGKPDAQSMTDWVDISCKYFFIFTRKQSKFPSPSLLQSLHFNSSSGVELEYGHRRHSELVLRDSVPSAYPDLESYYWHYK